MIHRDTEEFRAIQRLIRNTMRGEAEPSEVMLRLLELMADISENVQTTESKQSDAILALGKKIDNLSSKIDPLPLAQLASVIGALQSTGTSGSITLPQRVDANEQYIRQLREEMISLRGAIGGLTTSITGLEKKIEQSNRNSYGSSNINGRDIFMGVIAFIFLASIVLQILGGAL